MRERRYVKFRVDMLSDTKSKIIDTKPERDLIHYVWMAFVLLAGRVNLEGDLYLSKNLPYTIETLAIEFNRSEEQIKLALDVFIELEMVELTEDGIYRVKNFAKHQNIKVKEKIKSNCKEEDIKNESEIKDKEVQVKENNIQDETNKIKHVKSENIISENEVEKVISNETGDKENTNKDISKNENNRSDETIDDTSKNMVTMFLEKKKSKLRTRKKKKDDITDEPEEENEDEIMDWYNEGERPLAEGERVIKTWTC